jgi:hypothetical protein
LPERTTASTNDFNIENRPSGLMIFCVDVIEKQGDRVVRIL